ncbi:MAG: hypothetical protein HMLKMBBP_03651 [Planctomycetes bacterium]|nr:hypothetical protein [Planctomycetota bacterium]
MVVLVLLAGGTALAGAEDGASATARLLRDLGAESEAVRERAADALESADDLGVRQLAAAVRAADARSLPLLLRIAGSKRMKPLAGDAARIAAEGDAVAAEAAIRALVRIGPEAVAAGAEALAASKDPSAAPRAARLRALDAQCRVEREVFSRWRKKGGSYRGRYADLEKAGFEGQVVLLAMLLDIPLEDRFLAPRLPGTKEGDAIAHYLSVTELCQSPRRGYRTFEPLPHTIEREEMFALAAQALADVADLGLVGDALEETRNGLMEAHDNFPAFRARPFEDQFAEDIDVLLAARGRPRFLEARRAEAASDVQMLRRRRFSPADDPDGYYYLSTRISKLAGILHQLGRFDEAAARYAEVIAIQSEITGKVPATATYNRACALARAGRVDEALDDLERAIDKDEASGFEDLTREWVSEDGDLEPLRALPRYAQILRARFGD